MAKGVGRPRRVPGQGRPGPPEILCAGDVPLSVGAHPHGACAQLHHGRCGGAHQDGARLQRAAPDGLGCLWHARGKRRDGTGRPPRHLDRKQHHGDEGPDEAARPVDRLVARDCDLPARLLRPAAGDVPGFPGRRAGLSQGRRGELGPGRHDRAGQRTGDRRQGLAVRCCGGTARTDAMVLPDFRLFRGIAVGAGRLAGLARKGAPDAGQLDRQVARPAICVRHRGRPARL